jgi:NitT/TauT family transport system permease protein
MVTTITEKQKKMMKIKKTIFSFGTAEKIGSLIVLIIVWQILAVFSIHIPSPIEVLSVSIEYIPTTQFVGDVTTSMGRIAAGFILGTVTGVPLGLFMGWKRVFKNWAFPTFEVLRPIPPLAWIPLAVIMFSTIEDSIIFIIWTGAFFPIVLNTMLGVSSVPEHLRNSSLSFGVNQRQMLRHVIIPASMPAILTGMTLGMGITWNALVAAEMLAGGSGVGYQLWYYYIVENFSLVVMFMIIIGAVGYLFSSIIRIAGRRYLRWSQEEGK